MAITFGPGKDPFPAPNFDLAPQVASLVNKTGDLAFRIEKLEFVYNRVFKLLGETLERIKSLEQHYLYVKEIKKVQKPKNTKKK